MIPHEPSATMLQIPELYTYIAQTKAPASARNYNAVVRRFRQYLGSDTLEYDRLDAAMVADFGQWLIAQGLTPASAGLFQRCLRALLKDVAPADRLPGIKTAFAAVSSHNIGASTALEPADMRRLATEPLPDALDKIRVLTLWLTLSGGMTLTQLQQSLQPPASSPKPAEGPQACAYLERHFQARHGISLADYARRLTEDNYRQGQRVVSAALQLQPSLDRCSEGDLFVNLARQLRPVLQPGDIAAALQSVTAYSGSVEASRLTAVQRLRLLNRVGRSVIDLTPRWYAIRFFGIKGPDHAADYAADLAADPVDPADTFIVPPPVVKPGTRPPAGSAIMQSLLFVRTHSRHIQTLAARPAEVPMHLYTSRLTRRPAHIPDHDMKLFMLLADTARSTIRCYFPDEDTAEDIDSANGLSATNGADGTGSVGSSAARNLLSRFKAGAQAKINIGPFSGNVGIIDRPRPDSYTVVIRLTTLGGALVTADLPAEFITPL